MSSVPAGTPLKGLNFIKGKTDPVAMEDSEYPEWLWRILEDKKVEEETGTDADIYCKLPKPLRGEILETKPLTLGK
jgi:large subunit ribosomal protein L54